MPILGPPLNFDNAHQSQAAPAMPILGYPTPLLLYLNPGLHSLL